MGRVQHSLALKILGASFLLVTSGCDRTVTYSSSAGEMHAGDTRIRYYIDKGTKGEPQRVLLVMGSSVAIGMGTNKLSWTRSLEGDSKVSPIGADESVWIVWEDDAIQPVNIDPLAVARMIKEWSDDQPIPTELARAIQRERDRKTTAQNNDG